MRDSVRVGAALARALFARSVPAGAFERQAYAFHKGPAGRARAALHIAAISLAPNSFVAGIEADALVLHRLVRREGKAE